MGWPSSLAAIAHTSELSSPPERRNPTGMQPFTAPDGSAVVCNGELYGFRKLKRELEGKGYAFASGSDCELLLPLWQERGTAMFGELDAEFAMVLYDAPTDSFVAARDPIGIRPLYYGYSESGRILFASEPKGLLGLTDKIMPFPPGHYYEDGRFVRYRDISRVESFCQDDLECKGLHPGGFGAHDGQTVEQQRA